MSRRKPLKYPFGEFKIASVREPVPQTPCSRPPEIYAYWNSHIAPSPQMQLPDKEHVVVILQNVRLDTLGWTLVSMGGLDEAPCHPRDVLRPALVGAAWAFVLIHNHPSGDPTPSHPDRAITRRLKEAADILGLHFTDHLIIGAPSQSRPLPYFSFLENGLL